MHRFYIRYVQNDRMNVIYFHKEEIITQFVSQNLIKKYNFWPKVLENLTGCIVQKGLEIDNDVLKTCQSFKLGHWTAST